MSLGARAVLFDRDGVLNELSAREPAGSGEAPLHPAQVRLTSGAAPALERLRRAGYRLGIVTNQPGAAKGECSLEMVKLVQAEVERQLADRGVAVDTVQVCLHHPDGTPGHPLRRPCGCRKPAPGLLLSALGEMGADPRTSWMVGDSDRDIEAGRAAGLSTVLVASPGGDHRRSGHPVPDALVPDLAGAVEAILGGTRAAVRAAEPPTTI